MVIHQRLWTILLGTWLTIAVPVSYFLVLISLRLWPLMAVALPLAIGATAIFVYLLSYDNTPLASKSRMTGLIGVSASGVIVLGAIMAARVLLHVVLFLGVLGGGGLDSPETIISGISQPLRPYFLAVFVFYAWALVPLVMLTQQATVAKARA